MERENKVFPNTLIIHCKTLGYTQRQVAAFLGLHDSVPISLWEKGKTLPNSANLLKLSAVYRVCPSVLYDELFSSFRTELQEM